MREGQSILHTLVRLSFLVVKATSTSVKEGNYQNRPHLIYEKVSVLVGFPETSKVTIVFAVADLFKIPTSFLRRLSLVSFVPRHGISGVH